MTKIFYDNSRLPQLNSELGELQKKLNNTCNLANRIYIPSGFRRYSDISECSSTVRSAIDLVNKTGNWLATLDKNFNSKNDEIANRIQIIDKTEIKKQDLLVK